MVNKGMIQRANDYFPKERKTTASSVFHKTFHKLWMSQGEKIVFSEGPVIFLYTCALTSIEKNIVD